MITYKRTVERYTSLIIESNKISTYEADVNYFNLEIDINGSKRYRTINAIKSGDFKFIGSKDVIVKRLLIGTVVKFRVQFVKINKEESNWSSWANETVGDVSNLLTFKIKLDSQSKNISVVNTSTSTTFNVDVNSVPSDFEQFEWKIVEQTALLNDDPLLPPGMPTTPIIDAVPDYITKSLDTISLSMSKNRTTWWHCWIRAIDESGNIGTDGWYYIGCGKITVIDLKIDQDTTPPDNTDIETPVFVGAGALNFV